MLYNVLKYILHNTTLRCKMALTMEQIHAAADKIANDGVKPTLAKVRTALGGGSFTTINDAMQSWKLAQQQEQELQQVELPIEVSERLHALGAQIWDAANDIANSRLIAEREALATIKAEALAETEEAREAVKTLELEQNDLIAALETSAKDNDQLSNDLKNVEIEYDNFKKSEAEAAIEYIGKFSHEKQRAETAEKDVDNLHGKLEQSRQVQSKSIEELATVREQKKSQEVDIQRLTVERDSSIERLNTVLAEQNITQQALAAAQGKLEVLEKQSAALSAEKIALADQLNKKSEEGQSVIIELELLKVANEQHVKELKALKVKPSRSSKS